MSSFRVAPREGLLRGDLLLQITFSRWTVDIRRQSSEADSYGPEDVATLGLTVIGSALGPGWFGFDQKGHESPFHPRRSC